MDGKLIFFGNLHGDITLENLRSFVEVGGIQIVDKPGSIDLKLGYAFVNCEESETLAEKIDALNKQCIEGFESRPITVEFTKSSNSELKRREERRRQAAGPCEHLFVVGFDPSKTKGRDIEYEFNKIAKVKNLEMIKSYANVEFYSTEDATSVLERFNGNELFGRNLTIEYRAAAPRSAGPAKSTRRGDSRDRAYRNEGYRMSSSSYSSSPRYTNEMPLAYYSYERDPRSYRHDSRDRDYYDSMYDRRHGDDRYSYVGSQRRPRSRSRSRGKDRVGDRGGERHRSRRDSRSRDRYDTRNDRDRYPEAPKSSRSGTSASRGFPMDYPLPSERSNGRERERENERGSSHIINHGESVNDNFPVIPPREEKSPLSRSDRSDSEGRGRGHSYREY